jgi:transposase-like protein
MQVQEQVLTLLIEAHASYRDIQACLLKLCGKHISLGSIARIVQEAGRRAQGWLRKPQASTPRAWALDEQYSSQRGKASLNVIDVHSGQVWATLPRVAVDGESWTLVWW